MFKVDYQLTTKNSKLGAIKSCSVKSKLTCRADAPCLKVCYTSSGAFNYKNVKERHNLNTMAIIQSPEYVENVIVSGIMLDRYFRWNVAGDIFSDSYLQLIINVARRTPDTKHLVYTKYYERVNSYLDAGGTIPDNLNIVFSTWSGLDCPNPHNLPATDCILKDGSSYHNINENALGDNIKPCNCNANTKELKHTCDKCLKCWHLKKGDILYFKEHK